MTESNGSYGASASPALDDSSAPPTRPQLDFVALRATLKTAALQIDIEKMLFVESDEREAGVLAIAAIKCLLNLGWLPPYSRDDGASSRPRSVEDAASNMNQNPPPGVPL